MPGEETDKQNSDTADINDDDSSTRKSIRWGRSEDPSLQLDNQDDQLQSLACVPSLDPHGELPRGAYYRSRHGQASAHFAKDICRIAIALDCEATRLDNELDVPAAVQRLQALVDDGLQTFQVKATADQSTTEQVLGRFLAETPGFARDGSNILIPFQLPSAPVSPTDVPLWVRRQVIASLVRLGAESLDGVQISMPKTSSLRGGGSSSPYFLDILDALQDLQREGLVRSCSGRNLTPLQIREAVANGFDDLLDYSQLDMNVLNPAAYTTEQKLLCADLKHLRLLIGSPLAGGLLADASKQFLFPPLSTQLSVAGNRHLKTTLPQWNKRLANNNDKKANMAPWQRFHGEMLPALADLALQHRVSIATICLRWVLQQQHVASTTVSCSLLQNDNPDKTTAQRIKAFRNVFRFALDEDEVQQLWQLSGMEEPPDDLFSFAFNNNDDDDDQGDFARFEQRNGLFLP